MTLASVPVTLPTRLERIRGPLIACATVSAATLALHLRDPHVSRSWGVCPLYALTGLFCPGCGGMRGVNDLTNGHVAGAASSNLLLVLAVPLAALLFARWSYGAWTGRDIRAVPVVPKPVTTALVLLAMAFTVARNLPGSWLAP
jgi:Protein of unknown function (DUF2752)